MKKGNTAVVSVLGLQNSPGSSFKAVLVLLKNKTKQKGKQQTHQNPKAGQVLLHLSSSGGTECIVVAMLELGFVSKNSIFCQLTTLLDIDSPKILIFMVHYNPFFLLSTTNSFICHGLLPL